MRTLIQHRYTQKFLTPEGRWVDEESGALVFKSSLEALDYCCRHKIWEAMLVLKFADARFDIQLHPFDDGPLPGANPDTPAENPDREPVSPP